MTALIIEDEQPAARRLIKLIAELRPDIHIAGETDGIAGLKTWLETAEMPDLVFCDIHLADGSAFQLLREIPITAPVIFTTAYDEYALEAFQTSGTGYLLKPVKKDALEAAINKAERLIGTAAPQPAAPATPRAPGTYKQRFLVRFGEFIRTLLVEDIAYCFSENKATYARCFDGRTLPLDDNLDALESVLDPAQFFRLNRQYIIHIKAIAEMRTYTKARVIVTLNPPAKEQPVVSSERAAEFKQWLAGDLE